MGKFHKLALNFSGWPFSATVTRYLRPKSDHANEWVYRKSTDRSMEVFLETFLPFFGYRKKHFWKKFCQETSFRYLQKVLKKYSSKCCKYNGYRSVINIAQNFGHFHNKNFNFYTRQMYFTDQIYVILRSLKITKGSRKRLDLLFLWVSIPKTLKWNIVHAQIMVWYTSLTFKIYRSEKNIWKISKY